MDYVREELLRQRWALEALLLTGAADEAPEAEETDPVQERAAEMLAAKAGEDRFPERSAPLRSVRRSLRGAEPTPWSAGAFPETETISAVPEWGGSLGPARMQVQVREVSRAVERDARRYDGGFTMY